MDGQQDSLEFSSSFCSGQSAERARSSSASRIVLQTDAHAVQLSDLTLHSAYLLLPGLLGCRQCSGQWHCCTHVVSNRFQSHQFLQMLRLLQLQKFDFFPTISQDS